MCESTHTTLELGQPCYISISQILKSQHDTRLSTMVRTMNMATCSAQITMHCLICGKIYFTPMAYGCPLFQLEYCFCTQSDNFLRLFARYLIVNILCTVDNRTQYFLHRGAWI